MAISPDRAGQILGAGDTEALFLKVYSGEVLQQFRESNVMRPLLQMRTIPYGKSAQFPILGKATAFVHQPGENILSDTPLFGPNSTDTDGGVANAGTTKVLQAFSHNERTIFIDQKIIAPTVIPDIDEIKNHYDLRSRYAGEMGASVSYVFDKAAILSLIVAARVASNNGSLVAGEPGGGTDGNAGRLTVGSTPFGPAIADACFAAAQRFDEIDLPKTERYFVLSPQMAYACIKDPQIYAMLQTGATAAQVQRVAALASNITTQTGIANSGLEGFSNANLMYGSADWVNGTIGKIAGIQLVVSNHIPSTNLSTGTGTTNFWKRLGNFGSNGNTYAINCSSNSGTKGVIFHKSAIGCLQVRDLSLASEWREELQGTLMVAKLLSGMSWLRPSSAIEVTAA